MTGDLARAGQSGYGAGKSETLHWANGLLVFTTNGNGVLDDLKIGQLADITTLPGVNGGTPGLTIWDRELSGRQASWHSSAGIGNWFPPGDPTAGYNLNHPDDRGILPVQMPQTDGFTDRHSVFQGARVYDYDMGQWTSADPSSGGLDNPFSFRRYLYDNGNPNSYSDPSGNDPTFNNGTPPDQNNPAGGLIGAIVAWFGGLFSGLFGGGHHSSAPAPPAQVEPQDPSAFANDATVDQQELQRYVSANRFVNDLGVAAPAIIITGLSGGVGAAALGLGGEVSGAAAVETAAGVAAEEAQVETATASGPKFANNDRLEDHFQLHGADFGATSASEYEAQAGAFMSGELPSDVLETSRIYRTVTLLDLIQVQMSLESCLRRQRCAPTSDPIRAFTDIRAT